MPSFFRISCSRKHELFFLIKCEPNEVELFMSLLLSYSKNNKDWDEKTLQKNDIENLFTNIYDASKTAKCEFIDDHRWKRNIKENIKN